MSAKLLYSLSEENPNLQKQIGCMNGFLQFFERRHLISNRSHNRRLTQGDNSCQGNEVNGTSNKSKKKYQVIPETQGNPTEPSRFSVSSSTGSSLSMLEYDSAPTKLEQPTSDETVSADTHHQDTRTKQTLSSPNTSCRFHMKNVVIDSISTCPSPIRTPKKEQVVRHAAKHMDSPRLASLDESFRSVSSNQSAPTTPLRRKDGHRMSYDGTETREVSVSGFKVGDLPRLSLDSRQRTMRRSSITQHFPEEPTSYRAPSNIVAKLMGLEGISDCSSTNQGQICGRLDPLSRSSRTVDEIKLSRVLDSPRSKYKDLRSRQFEKEEHQEANSEPCDHSTTVYAQIEKRLADIDFKKSGKDLRALKQILEAMHKEKKAMLERRKEDISLSSTSETSSGNYAYISQTQNPRKQNRRATCSVTHRTGARLSEEAKSPRSVKQDKPITRSRKVGPNEVPQRSHGLRAGQPVNTVKHTVENRTAKDRTPNTNRGQNFTTTSVRRLNTLKFPQHMNELNQTSSESLSSKTVSSRTKQHNQITTRSCPQNRGLQQSSSELRSNSVCLNQQGKADSWVPENKRCLSQSDDVITSTDQSSQMKNDLLHEVRDKKHAERILIDESFPELAISIKEQPSPVSVLDSAFYGDESPSPVKKKPTVFQGFYADDDSTETSTEAEWKDNDLNNSPYNMRSNFSHDNNYTVEKNFKQSAEPPRQLTSGEDECIPSTLYKEVNLEKAYVAEILSASGFLESHNITVIHQLPAINPNLFFLLEQTTASRFFSDRMPSSKENTKTNERHQRKLIFDAVNEIVSQKLEFTSLASQSQPFLKRPPGVITGQQLVQGICKEMNQFQLNSPYQSLDNEDDFLTAIIEKDLNQRPGNWADINSETSRLVLDIERLIFKDLIVEFIQGEASL